MHSLPHVRAITCNRSRSPLPFRKVGRVLGLSSTGGTPFKMWRSANDCVRSKAWAILLTEMFVFVPPPLVGGGQRWLVSWFPSRRHHGQIARPIAAVGARPGPSCSPSVCNAAVRPTFAQANVPTELFVLVRGARFVRSRCGPVASRDCVLDCCGQARRKPTCPRKCSCSREAGGRAA